MELLREFKALNKNDAALAGGKGASLGEMTSAGIPVPPGFVILSAAFERFLAETDLNVEIDTVLHAVNHQEIHTVDAASEKIQALILGSKMPKDLELEIKKSFKKLGAKFVAVRSSATAEDSSEAAWAGQLDSFLNTTEGNLLENVKKCWASLFTPRAIFYRFEKKLHKTIISVAVVVQKMVESEVSGIAFSVHPVTEDRNQLIIEAGLGLGEAIVSGQITPDSYVIEKTPRRIIDKNVSEQSRGIFKNNKGGGNLWKDIPANTGSAQKLSDSQILELSELILRIENHYGFPCDIEWAFARPSEGLGKGQFYIVQSRPITTLKNASTESKKTDGLELGSNNYSKVVGTTIYIKPSKEEILAPFKGKDEWMLAENIPDMDMFFAQVFLSCFTSDSSYPFIKNYSETLTCYKGFVMDFYFGKRDSFEVAESILKALVEKPDFGDEVNKNIVLWSKKLVNFAEKVSAMDLSQKSNTELWQLYEKHDGIHTKLYTYGWLPVAVDMFHNNFTNKLKEYLRSVCAGNKEVEETFVVLCTPTRKTIIAKEREDFLKIFEKYHTVVADAVAKISDKIPAAMRKDLDKHATEWGHLGYIYSGNTDPFGPNHYFQEMVDLAKSGITPKQILDREEKQLEDAEQKKQILYKKIKISPTYKRLFNTANDFALTKLVRRDAQLRDMLLLHRSLLTEIAKRLNITRAQVQFMLQGEIRDALEDGLIDRDKIADRLKNSSVLYTKKDFERIYVGEEAEILRRDIKTEIDHTQTEFRGQTAQPGFAKGTVKIVIRAKDMAKMNQGDILVSIATDPDIVPAMKKAAAIITEQGGITSHAAIVSRELGTPCIIGTKIATKLLKDGDIVEVDANNGVVKILKK